MKQGSRRGQRAGKKRTVAGLPVCFLLFHVNETLVSCVTTLEVDVATVDEYRACEQWTQLIESALDRPSISTAQTSDPRGKETS